MLAWNLFGCLWLPIWSLLWSLSLQQDETFAFVNPPPSQSTISDPVYDVGDPIDIQWVGSNSFVSVRLVHWLPDSNLDEFVYVFDNVTNLGGHFTWVVDLGSMNLTVSNTFFFNIFVEGETTPRAVSHNITLANPSTSTTASTTGPTTTHTTLSTSTTAASTTTSTTSAPASTTTTSAPTTSAASSSSGLDSGAKAGIGVGVAVGALAILAVGFFFWRRSRASNAAAGGGAGGANAPPPNYQPVNQQAHSGYYKPQPPGALSELSEGTSRQPPSELLGSGSTAHEMPDTSRA